ncbi:DNA-binding protein WhiA [[Mycoplasma] falconis]|uniref:Probable cell division protein WhiA n=1 Tax=[Mycoplasma] falconis TaxID=92403 RepID=A0A501XCL6_9BACT|nr:DNA-binding protein WhiA [[Mycoplasma] falconis]TPE58034.1 DNA-binding protein WhiA [[Mycoplasma] falconis]
MEKSFARDIKNEILLHKLSKNQKLNLCSGILATAKITNQKAKLIVNNNEIFSFISKLFFELKVYYINERKNSFSIDLTTFKNNTLKKERDYFAGIFLTSGSISDLDSNTNHLEIKFYNHDYALEVVNILNNYGLDFKILKRNNRYLVYCKKVENICDFLKAIETIDSYYRLEETKIERDYYNNINRITNFDIYNQERIAKANVAFLDNLKFIKENHLEDKFTDEELKFFNLKEQNLDTSLSDLANMLKNIGIVRSKSALNHSLIKLKKIVNKFKN